MFLNKIIMNWTAENDECWNPHNRWQTIGISIVPVCTSRCIKSLYFHIVSINSLKPICNSHDDTGKSGTHIFRCQLDLANVNIGVVQMWLIAATRWPHNTLQTSTSPGQRENTKAYIYISYTAYEWWRYYVYSESLPLTTIPLHTRPTFIFFMHSLSITGSDWSLSHHSDLDFVGITDSFSFSMETGFRKCFGLSFSKANFPSCSEVLQSETVEIYKYLTLTLFSTDATFVITL